MLTEQANELGDFIDKIISRLKQNEVVDKKAMGAVEVMAVLYGTAMAYDPLNPLWEYRDRLFYYRASGTTAIQAYSTMRDCFDGEAFEVGGTPYYYQSTISGCAFDTSEEGICEAIRSTVGHTNHNPFSYTFLVVDGDDLEEDSFWEGVSCAHYLALDRLILVVVADGRQDSVRTANRFYYHGWDVYECHHDSIFSIQEALNQAKKTEKLPSVVVLSK